MGAHSQRALFLRGSLVRLVQAILERAVKHGEIRNERLRTELREDRQNRQGLRLPLKPRNCGNLRVGLEVGVE